jgi:hypothetical protein
MKTGSAALAWFMIEHLKSGENFRGLESLDGNF